MLVPEASQQQCSVMFLKKIYFIHEIDTDKSYFFDVDFIYALVILWMFKSVSLCRLCTALLVSEQ